MKKTILFLVLMILMMTMAHAVIYFDILTDMVNNTVTTEPKLVAKYEFGESNNTNIDGAYIKDDNNPLGADVTTELIASDDVYQQFRSSQNEDFLWMNFSNVVPNSSQVIEITFWIEYYGLDLPSNPFYLQWLNSSTWQNVCPIYADTTSEVFESCDLTFLPDTSLVKLRFTDKNQIDNNVEIANIDHVYLYAEYQPDKHLPLFNCSLYENKSVVSNTGREKGAVADDDGAFSKDVEIYFIPNETVMLDRVAQFTNGAHEKDLQLVRAEDGKIIANASYSGYSSWACNYFSFSCTQVPYHTWDDNTVVHEGVQYYINFTYANVESGTCPDCPRVRAKTQDNITGWQLEAENYEVSYFAMEVRKQWGTMNDVNLTDDNYFVYQYEDGENDYSFDISCENDAQQTNDSTDTYFYTAYPYYEFQVQSNLVDGTFNFNNETMNIDYFAEVFDASDIFDCSLYVDEVLNQTQNNVNITQVQEFSTVSIPYVEKEMLFNISCENDDTSDSQLYSYRVDRIIPRIWELTGLMSGFNVTKVLDDNVTFQLELYDPNFYARNGTLFCNNTVFFNDFAENVSSTNITYVFNVSDLPIGSCLFRQSVWDSHTNEKVKELQWYFDDDNLIADDDIVWEGDFLEYDGQGRPATYFYLSEDGTKYKLKMTFPNQAMNHTINISSPSGNLNFRPDDGYLGHFVYFPTRRWVDHQGKNIKDVTVTTLEENKWSLFIEHYNETDEVEMESLGDLNNNTKEWEFEVLTCPENWESYYSNCSINDTMELLYRDTNQCNNDEPYIPVPIDNGTISDCDYCTLVWHYEESSCIDYKIYNVPTYDNYESCCNVTGIEEDCDLPDNVFLSSCTGIHSMSDITGAVVDFAVEIGVQYIALAGLVAIVSLGIVLIGLI